MEKQLEVVRQSKNDKRQYLIKTLEPNNTDMKKFLYNCANKSDTHSLNQIMAMIFNHKSMLN